MIIQRIEEFKILPDVHHRIALLLEASFTGYPKGKSFYKQVPHFRYLVWKAGELVGHMAVDHRIVTNSDDAIRIFGISDLCVANAYQHQKLATHLLQRLECLGRENGIEFLLLMAKEHRLYLNSDFELVDNTCRWLMIDQQRSFGIIDRKVQDALMVKALGAKRWKSGYIDFLGHIF